MFPSTGYVTTTPVNPPVTPPPPTTDLSNYVTTTQLQNNLALYATTDALSATVAAAFNLVSMSNAGSIFVNGIDNMGIISAEADFNKVYVIRSTASGTTPRTVNLLLPWNESGDGAVLIFNASPTAPLRVYSQDSVFLREGQPEYWDSGNFNLPPGKWMHLYRTDLYNSGYTVSGGINPTASWRITYGG